MAKIFYPDFFNDVFGPIMQPGSSSSFAGTSRIGRIARHSLKSAPAKARILFNAGDRHLENLGNMMEDRAYLGGLQDFETDDIRLFAAHEHAREARISYSFGAREKNDAHEGSVTFELEGREGDRATVTAESIGGGMVRTYAIHGFPIEWQADTHAVLAFGNPEAVSPAREREAAARLGTKLVHTIRARREDGKEAVFLEFEEAIPAGAAASWFPGAEIRNFPALLPVVTRHDKEPQLFRTVAEWRAVAETRGISFAEAAIEYERASSRWSRAEIVDFFENIASIMHGQVHSLETIGYDNAKDTPLLPIYGKQWKAYTDGSGQIADTLTNHILVHAFATNAKLPGVRIVPGPMGTGGGYLFSALDAVREAKNIPHERLIESLAVAAALGAIAFTHTNASGVVGCVGESGVCCAMASGAVAWLAGGDGFQVERAASMALQANIGIPCDPIPGGLEFPCLTRTLRAAVTAPLYADLALAGIDSLVPYHEALLAIQRNYENAAPGTLSGAKCGFNCTPTAERCQEFLKRQMADKLSHKA